MPAMHDAKPIGIISLVARGTATCANRRWSFQGTTNKIAVVIINVQPARENTNENLAREAVTMSAAAISTRTESSTKWSVRVLAKPARKPFAESGLTSAAAPRPIKYSPDNTTITNAKTPIKSIVSVF